MVSLYCRDDIHLHQGILWQFRYLHRGPCRLAGEVPCVDGVHPLEIPHVFEIDRYLERFFHRGACRFQNGLQIFQDLGCLGLYARSFHLSRARVQCDLAGDEDEVVIPDCLAVRPYRLRRPIRFDAFHSVPSSCFSEASREDGGKPWLDNNHDDDGDKHGNDKREFCYAFRCIGHSPEVPRDVYKGCCLVVLVNPRLLNEGC